MRYISQNKCIAKSLQMACDNNFSVSVSEMNTHTKIPKIKIIPVRRKLSGTEPGMINIRNEVTSEVRNVATPALTLPIGPTGQAQPTG